MQISNYNKGAAQALRLLEKTDVALGKAEQVMASGLKVREAADNPSYWSISTSMRADLSVRQAACDGLTVAANIVDVALKGLQATLPLLDRFRQLMVQAADPATDPTALDKEMTSLREQLVSVVKSSSFNGVNLLYHKNNASFQFNYISGLTNDSNGALQAKGATLDLTTIALYDEAGNQGWFTKAFSPGTSNTWRRLISVNPGNFLVGVYYTGTTRATGFAYTAANYAFSQMMNGVNQANATLGALKASLDSQIELTQKLAAVQKKGIGRLVDADMTEESAKLKALQVRQQLGIQALAIANEKPRHILALFR